MMVGRPSGRPFVLRFRGSSPAFHHRGNRGHRERQWLSPQGLRGHRGRGEASSGRQLGPGVMVGERIERAPSANTRTRSPLCVCHTHQPQPKSAVALPPRSCSCSSPCSPLCPCAPVVSAAVTPQFSAPSVPSVVTAVRASGTVIHPHPLHSPPELPPHPQHLHHRRRREPSRQPPPQPRRSPIKAERDQRP